MPEAHQRAFRPIIIIDDLYLQTFVHTLKYDASIILIFGISFLLEQTWHIALLLVAMKETFSCPPIRALMIIILLLYMVHII